VLTTCANRQEADALAAALVEPRLAACVNIVEDVWSTYRWRSKVETSQETLVLIKTTADRFDALELAIRERASYELPEVLAVPVHSGSTDYLEWLQASVTPEN